VAVFSRGCRDVVRVAGKGVVEKRLKVDPSTPLRARSLKLKGERLGDVNTETRSTQRSETGTDLEIGAGGGIGDEHGEW